MPDNQLDSVVKIKYALELLTSLYGFVGIDTKGKANQVIEEMKRLNEAEL